MPELPDRPDTPQSSQPDPPAAQPAIVPGPGRSGRRRRRRARRAPPPAACPPARSPRTATRTAAPPPRAARPSRSCSPPPTRTRPSTPDPGCRRATPTSSGCSAPRSSTTARWPSSRSSPTGAAARSRRRGPSATGSSTPRSTTPATPTVAFGRATTSARTRSTTATRSRTGSSCRTAPPTSAGSSGSSAPRSVTWRGPGIALAQLFARTRDRRYLDAAVRIGTWITTNTWSTAAARRLLVRRQRLERAGAERLDRAQHRLRRVLHDPPRAHARPGRGRRPPTTPARSST